MTDSTSTVASPPPSTPIFHSAAFDPEPEPVTPKKEGCYIATAVYGSYDAPQVITLRRFRDEKLKKTALGRLFIKVYYTVSPPLADRLRNAKKVNGCVRSLLDRCVAKLDKSDK